MLSMESACNIFYGIYDNGGRSNIISDLLRRLDFHALSITLLATVASRNMWDYDNLVQEWDTCHMQVPWTDYGESLAVTLELSLTSPTFLELGPDARDLLGVVAFFPQGVSESNVDWLFPTIPDRKNMFDKFCTLSLTYRSNGFVTMLAPLRDHLCPKDPMSSRLLQTTKECYFTRLSIFIDPGQSGFEETRWIVSEDTNIEHLLDAFTLVDADSVGVWDACADFMRHLYWHKPRLVILGPKIEGLPDDSPSKAPCLAQLLLLLHKAGKNVERKRPLIHPPKLPRVEGDNSWVARTLRTLSDANRMLGFYKEGIRQVKEALEIYKLLNDISGQALSLSCLAWLFHDDKQLDAAEDAAAQAVDLSNKDEQFLAFQCHCLLGDIYRSKGETGVAIKHLETALRIGSPFNWHNGQFWIHRSLAELFFGENMLDNARAHIELAKLHVVNDTYNLGRAMGLQAEFWYQECRFEEARSAAFDQMMTQPGVRPDSALTAVQGGEEESTQSPAGSGVAERVEIDENGVGKPPNPAPTEPPELIQLDSDAAEDTHLQEHSTDTRLAASTRDVPVAQHLGNISRSESNPQIQGPSPSTPIPQRQYCQGAIIQGGRPGQIIAFAMADGGYFPAELALTGQCDRLVDGNDTVLPGHNQPISLRIKWPGYDGWSAQISVVSYQVEPKKITRARLVKEIAKRLRNFIEKMEPAPIDPAYASYKVGHGGIELRHIRIAALKQVSRGSWQPRLAYSG